MTIVTSTYRYKRPPRKRKTAPLAGPAIATPERQPTDRKPPAAAVVAEAVTARIVWLNWLFPLNV